MPLRLCRLPATALLLAIMVAVAACGPTASPSPVPTGTPTPSVTPATPSGSPQPSESPQASADPDSAAIYSAIEEAVIDLRGLDPEEDVQPQLLNEDELRERTEKSFTEDNPAELIAAYERLYRALGMLGADQSLTDLYLELLGSQVAGFYDYDVDELFVVARSGGLGITERVTYAHEYTHALQDQHFDLKVLLDQEGEGDRASARLALVEGDATAAMVLWARAELTPEEALELLQAQDPEAQALLERAPPILRESLTFPYERGLQLVFRLQAEGGWEAVDDAYADPPASTEQVLHPEKYDAREAPDEVDLPADLAERMGDGWTLPYEDTFGEFQFQVWLRNALDATIGNPAAAGWGGDRFAVLEGPGDEWAVVMRTTWDSAAEASEFEAAASQAIDDGDHGGTVLIDDEEVTVVVASDRATLNQAVSAAGFVVSG